MGTSYALLWNEWVLLTHCFWRSAPYAMLLMLIGQMHGNCLRTALAQCSLRSVPYVCLLNVYVKFLTLCSLCYYVKCVGAWVLLRLCALCLYFTSVGATYALRLAQCSELLLAPWSLGYVRDVYCSQARGFLPTICCTMLFTLVSIKGIPVLSSSSIYPILHTLVSYMQCMVWWGTPFALHV